MTISFKHFASFGRVATVAAVVVALAHAATDARAQLSQLPQTLQQQVTAALQQPDAQVLQAMQALMQQNPAFTAQLAARIAQQRQIGRASCRERVCQYV